MEDITEIPNKAGIYKLTCKSGKIYIGKANNLRNRINQHKNPKVKYHLQNAILKYGWESFTVDILEVFDDSKDNDFLLERESYYIEYYDSTNREKGYNICKYSNDTTGRKLSDETKEKMRRAKLGKPLSDEHKRKMRKPKSEETRKKMSIAQRGRTVSEETKSKQRESQKGNKNHLGKPHSEESIEKMRQARKNYWENKNKE